MTDQDVKQPGPNGGIPEGERQTVREPDMPATVVGPKPGVGRLLPDFDADIPRSALIVEAIDEPGPGGANHVYQVLERVERPEGSFPWRQADQVIRFQKGPISEAGVNGLTNEALLAIVADRLRGFQSGPFSCSENLAALQHVEVALGKLLARTRNRRARGVEGQNKA